MSHSTPRLRPGSTAVAIALTLVALTGCSDATSGTSEKKDGARAPSSETGLINIVDAGSPKEGGTITYGAFSEPPLLDPTKIIVGAAAGGIQLGMVYDTLMRWDSATNEVIPQMAQGLESDAEAKTWTLTLRPDVTFSDGTPVNAAAVAHSWERYVELKGGEAQLWNNNVDTVETPDDVTLIIRLKKPWSSFPYVLTTGMGMIVAEASDSGKAFTAIGAGPFTVERIEPQEKTTFKANPTYWDGRPPLDTVEVVYLNNPEATMDSYQAGDLQLALLRDPNLVDEALDESAPGYLTMVGLGNVAVINSAEGRPGADPRIRQALQMAIDPAQVRQRAFEGAGVASAEIFPDYSAWHSGVAALPFDPDAAKALLEEAKADGYDGKLTYLDGSDPASRNTALLVKASLESIGFEVTIELARSTPDQIQKVVAERDYDVSGWGIAWRDAGPYASMFASVHSQGNSTVGMATTAEMDALIEKFQGAKPGAEQVAIMGDIQRQWNEQVPALVWAPTAELLAFDSRLQGVESTSSSMVLLGNAWLGG